MLLSVKTRKRIEDSFVGMKGKKHSEETRKKMSLAKLGWVGGMKGRKHSVDSKKKIGDSNRGEKSGRWKGGTTPVNKIIRSSGKYKEWRIAVLQRDNWTCVLCFKYGGDLHADHIRPFALYPELRFEITNGRTLCVECHKNTPTYGSKKKVVF